MATQPKKTTIENARSRRVAAAKRSLTLVQGVVSDHLARFEEGQLPEADFVTSAVKYAQALRELQLLDMITESSGEDDGDPAANGTIEVAREDVEILVQLARAFVPAPALRVGADALLGRLETAAAPAAEPAGEQPPEGGQA
jgi:hypothetical protein